MAVETIAASIAAQGFSGLLGNLATSYVQRKIKALSSNGDEIKTDLNDHLHSTFQKCIEIKTILSDKKPEKTLDLYVDETFDVDGKEVDQYTLVEKVKKGAACVITGTGGGGKSMFMRYLWLSFFENPEGRIPFFLELRQLNYFTHNSISDFIFHSIIKSGSSISQLNFSKALKQGEFVLFFDGFDEINHDQREKVEQMIISLREANPNLTIIVTSRPDDRFHGWQQFEICKVRPLKKNQVVELVQKAPYVDEYKKTFLSQLDKLYGSHESFLTTPLLAYMMLVTFSYNQDIPKKMFLFYEQAFEALYTRHDLTKGGYRRKLYTGLERQELIKLLSYFCLKSYYDENFEFTDVNLNETIDKAKSIEGIDVVNENFIKDMSESICLLKKEGIVYSFTHRSFQEYFAANCIARVANRNVEKMFFEFSNRYNDSVMQMVYDINTDLFREKYIVPSAHKFDYFFSKGRDEGLFECFAENANLKIQYDISHGRKYFHQAKSSRQKKVIPRRMYAHYDVTHEGTLHSFYQNILRVTGNKVAQSINVSEFHKSDEGFMRKAVDLIKDPEIKMISLSAEGGELRFLEVNPELSKLLVEGLGKSGIVHYMRLSVEYFYDFVNSEVEKYRHVSKSFEELF
ncbi:NACHT domain-containing protein [Mycoplana dimorpha]|uniref:NACHT domain-containing protein n=1 Tax=Mycoplana dimorpha TaxID=28320 RepID=A0A2T5B8B5_MYCDI|nr:NACHT domain-containing protein [Mycoplana dimorpha]PTM95218.1 NACHT domain-containing protein [Mycoplana dimorpha]